MPPAPFVDLRELDLDTLEFGPDRIREFNPHRHEMELLTGVIAYMPDDGLIVGEVAPNPTAFWVRGHIPGRPLFPGVLMVEAGAQLSSCFWRAKFPDSDKFFGFGGIDNTRFRGVVTPEDRLIMVGKALEVRARRALFDVQGFVDYKMVFETRIMGIPF